MDEVYLFLFNMQIFRSFLPFDRSNFEPKPDDGHYYSCLLLYFARLVNSYTMYWGVIIYFKSKENCLESYVVNHCFENYCFRIELHNNTPAYDDVVNLILCCWLGETHATLCPIRWWKLLLKLIEYSMCIYTWVMVLFLLALFVVLHVQIEHLRWKVLNTGHFFGI